MSIFQKEVLDVVKNAMEGKTLQIPLHLERVKDVFAIRKNIYTVLGGGTGSGKTSLADDMFVLKPFSLWDKWKTETDITFRVLYRSMERKRSLKLTKWACWKMYQDTGLLIDAETLLGYKKTKVSKAVWEQLVTARDWADRLLDYVDIRDGRTTPSQHDQWVTEHALKHGTLFITDMTGMFDRANPGVYIDLFSPDKTQKLDSGDTVQVTTYEFKGQEIVMKKGERYYVPNRPSEITIVIADHVGKFAPEVGLVNKKQIIDKASDYSADFRDVFGYSPVDISQFNRAIGDIQRMKFSEGDLSPQIEDFKDTGNLVENADLVLALFNPYRYKSYDDEGMYKGYNIRDLMVNPQGYNRYRLLTVLKNSYGIDDVDFGLRFWGEVNNFETLPKPGEDDLISADLDVVYREIQQGL